MIFFDNQNVVASSSSSSSHSPLMEDEISVVRDHLSILTLSVSSDAQLLPTLSFDLIEEILCRLPVKLLLQLRCVCKSWNALISDPKFAKKHLSRSTTRLVHFHEFSNVARKFILKSYPIHSVFNNIITDFTQCEYPPSISLDISCSCNGILCLADDHRNFVALWNPSIRKFKELPPYQMTQPLTTTVYRTYGFGYDPFIDNYKVIAVLGYYNGVGYDDGVYKTEVMIHNLGTNSWKTIQEFPFGGKPVRRSGIFVSGAINWLGCEDLHRSGSRNFIVSLDLKNELFQEILMPSDYGEVSVMLTLGVMRDWLCLFYGDDVWVMKEHGNEESWTKLFTIFYPPNVRASKGFNFVVNFIEDDQVLLESFEPVGENMIFRLTVYDSKNDTFKFTDFVYPTDAMSFESLISPC